MSGAKPPRLPIERRTAGTPVELRDAGSGRPPLLAGVATTFETPYALDRFDEVIAATAFDPNFASGRNVRLLVHHADGSLLATTRAGTLRLRADVRGITFEADLPDTQLGRDTGAMVARRDLGGASIGFVCRRHVWNRTGDRPVRRIEEAELFEISLCAVPANELTSVELRASLDAFLAVDDAARETRRALARLELAPYQAQIARWLPPERPA